MSTFDAVLAQYEKNKNATSGNNNKMSSEDRMKRYFTTVLPKGSKGEERRIRILPTKDGSSPFVEVYFHEVQVDGKWVKLYDPKQEGKRSPLHEVYEGLMMTGVDTDKELARSYRSRKFYIVKVIDRDHEQDGVKFWRFKHNHKGDGVIDKIFPVFRNKGDVTNPENGRDLILSLALTKAPVKALPSSTSVSSKSHLHFLHLPSCSSHRMFFWSDEKSLTSSLLIETFTPHSSATYDFNILNNTNSKSSTRAPPANTLVNPYVCDLLGSQFFDLTTTPFTNS